MWFLTTKIVTNFLFFLLILVKNDGEAAKNIKSNKSIVLDQQFYFLLKPSAKEAKSLPIIGSYVII